MRMMRKVSLLGFGAVLLQGTVMGCSSLRVQPGTADAIHFETDVSPLLTKYCTGCHSGPNAPAAITLAFENEEEAGRKAVTEDDFWSRVATNVSSKQMPPPWAPSKPSDKE